MSTYRLINLSIYRLIGLYLYLFIDSWLYRLSTHVLNVRFAPYKYIYPSLYHVAPYVPSVLYV